jgi:dihydroflavonol-4-reductase
MKPILITGASGFLGRHLVELLRDTAPLRLLLRDPRSAPADAEVVHGDVTSPEDVRRAAEGVGQIYHLAGIVSRHPKDDPQVYRVHIEGTRNVCAGALAAGADKVVVVSSSGTVAVGKEPFAHDEESGYKQHVVGEWGYYLSKIFAEKLALDYFSRHGLPVVVVNPALLLGPGDERDTSTKDIRLFLEGKILAIPLGGMSVVDVRDTAAGLVAGMQRGRPGERYLLGGANWTFRRLIEEVAHISGVRAPRLQPPFAVQLWSGRLLRTIRPKMQGLDDATIKMSALYWYVDSRKAQAELGFRARDPRETLIDTVRDIEQRRRRR